MKQVSNNFVEQHEKCGVRANFISVDNRLRDREKK